MKTTKVENLYYASLALNGKEYEAEGADLDEVLKSIKPECFKTKGLLTVTKGDKFAKRLMVIPLMKKLFGINGANTQRFCLDFVGAYLKKQL